MLSFIAFRKKLIKEGYSHFREEFEGHRPENSGKCNDEEVSDSACDKLITEEHLEGLRQSRLDSEDDSKTEGELDATKVQAAVDAYLKELKLVDDGAGGRVESDDRDYNFQTQEELKNQFYNNNKKNEEEEKGGLSPLVLVLIIVGAVVVVAVVVIILVSKKKK